MTLGYPEYPIHQVALASDAIQSTPVIEFVLSGELDLSSAPAVRDELSRALDDVIRTGRPARMLLDLQNLTFIDSAGLQALVTAKRRCAQHGTSFSLRLGDTGIRHVLTVAGFSDFFHTEDEDVSA